MAKFDAQNISSTFKSILNIGACNDLNKELPASGQCIITDGMGTNSSLSLGKATQGMVVTGNIEGDSLICTTGNICGSSINASAGICSQDTLQSTGKLTVQGEARINGDSCTCGSFTIANNLTTVGDAVVNGTIYGQSDIIAFHSSDKNLKTDLNKINNSQTIIKGLTGYNFKWNEEAERNGKDLGIIAQDVEKVIPEIVHERENGYKAVDYIKLIPVLIEEIKRLDAEVEKLKLSN